MAKVTKTQIEHIADLSKLDLTEKELEKFDKEFNEILDYVSQIDECDTSDIKSEHNMADYKGTVLVEDKVKSSSITRDQMLQNATKGRNKNGYIRTSKIVTKE